MNNDQWSLAVIESDDGFLLLGDDDALTQFETHASLDSRRVKQQSLSLASKALGAVAHVQANSGRWVKLTEESAKLIKEHGPSLSKADKLMTGVVRGEAGKIVKHLRFENAALLTPAAPMMLASMMTQASLEAALDDIQEYLEVIDAKLDRLLKQRKIEALGQLGGVMLAIEEADTIYAHTGTVSGVTWSKVQANSLALQTMQAESIAQLTALADLVRERALDTDRSAAVLAEVDGEVSFWLGVLARTIALQDKQYVLELARIAATEPEQLDAHRAGLKLARRSRTDRIAQSLEAINASVRASSNLTNRDRVANPFSAQRVTERANGVNESITVFARHADLTLLQVEKVDRKTWGRAAKALIGEAADQVNSTSNDVATRARELGTGIQERGDDAVLRLAERAQQRRRARQSQDERRALDAGEVSE
ncbi:hypothetical protein [Agrococcus sp. DT81.2]|uniref:hypothetical protein n=1 Tax=Agrococcus sp. DT81.2 TaxID=3393414 RepID=UPI003CE484D1